MNELVKIENTVNIKGNDLRVVEYKGVRVLSSYDIAQLHGKPVRKVNEQFERNIDRLSEGTDYFRISKEEFSESFSGIQNFIPNNVKDIKLFTERGYLKLVKSFTDDLSWEVQDLLVDSYFKLQEVLSTKDTFLVDILRAKDDLSRAVAINKYELGYVKPLEEELSKQKITNGQLAMEVVKHGVKAAFYDDVLATQDLMTVTEIAQDYGMTARQLNQFLADKGIQYKQRGHWRLYAKYVPLGLAKTYTHICTCSEFKDHCTLTLKWTQKGREFIHKLLGDLDERLTDILQE